MEAARPKAEKIRRPPGCFAVAGFATFWLWCALGGCDTKTSPHRLLQAPDPSPPPAASPCSPRDDPAECEALVQLGAGLRYTEWKQHDGWMTSTSICSWHGISCNAAGHVTNLSLRENNLVGAISEAVGGLRHLEEFDVNGKRPSSYHGCAPPYKPKAGDSSTVGNNLRGTPIPVPPPPPLAVPPPCCSPLP